MSPRPHTSRVLAASAVAPLRPVEVCTAPPPIHTPRLMLRPLTAADREQYLRSARISRLALDRFLALHMDGESDEAMFHRQVELARLGPDRDWLRLVGVRSDGRIVGGFNLNAITRGLQWRADVNWWVASDLAGHGYATEGVGALLSHALADLPAGLGLQEVHAWITSDNLASIRIAHKLGMHRAGEETSYLLTGSARWVLHELWVKRAASESPATDAPSFESRCKGHPCHRPLL